MFTNPFGKPSVTCPKCGNGDMMYLSHLRMYGGYLCNNCGSIWGIDEPEIKSQMKK